MPRKLFTAPNLGFLTGENARPLQWIFRALNEYFRKHIGYWGEATGTTDINGRCVFTIDPGFEPAVVLFSEHYISGSAHDMGPSHIHDHSATHIDVHFLTKSGQDRDLEGVRIEYLVLPSTER
jgi:hypothetical protein